MQNLRQRDKGNQKAQAKPQQKQQGGKDSDNREGCVNFFFDSAYQIVTWVLIALSIGLLLMFLSQKNWRGVIGSLIALVCFVVLMLVLLARRYFPFLQSPASATSPEEGPTFEENVDICTLLFGSSVATSSLEILRTRHFTPFDINGVCPVLYAEGNNFYADVEVSGPDSHPVVTIKHNQLTVIPPQWDSNRNNNAFEVVNHLGSVVFQIIYKKPSTIIINGIFPEPGDPSWATYIDEHSVRAGFPVDEPPEDFVLRPIFKYPAWKYPGEFAE